MSSLGSVFEDEEAGASGPDLRVSIDVPRGALGNGLRARVPTRLAADGDLIERVVDPEDPERVLVFLPDTVEEGAVLRLRRQGGRRGDGPPGDLYLKLQFVDRRAEPDELVACGDAPGLGSSVRARGRDLTWWVLLALAAAATGAVGLWAVAR